MPAFLPVAIGAADITLYEQVGAYTVFPNDGIRIEPHYIRKVTQADGLPFDRSRPQVTEVISVETARTMMVLLQAVVRMGTGAAASQLKHPLGGKTGTTNNFTDAWFVGFSPSVTCGTWIGFDDRQSLGEKETGARAALPMWMDFMRAAIADKPNEVVCGGGCAEKELDVPSDAVGFNGSEGVRPRLRDEADPDAPAPPGGNIAVAKAGFNAAPADTAAPVGKKSMARLLWSERGGEAVSPTKGAAVPVTPEDERKGVAKPPSDRK